MKIIFRTAAIAALIITTSCGKDTADAIADIFEETEQLEKTALDASTVADNVIINGGTKNEGTPPTSNGAITLDISETSKTAFLDEGFDVSLNSDSDIVGAYLRFIAEDGTVADSYYDISLETNSTDELAKRSIGNRNRKSSLISKSDVVFLDVDFGPQITAGKFCYEICVYDNEGNISEPQEVCVKVEAWGGNSEAIGKWSLDKWFRDNDTERIYLEGIENCTSSTNDMYCQGLTFEGIESESCTLIEFESIELNADGTYIEKEKRIWTDTYSDISQNPCLEEAVSEEIVTYESRGKWAYLDDEDKFIFVAYFDEEVYQGESDAFTAEPGNGWIHYGDGGYNGVVTLSNGSLILQSFEETTAHYKK